MSTPSRWARGDSPDGPGPEVTALLAQASEVRSWPAADSARLLIEIERQIEARRRRWRWRYALGAVALATAGALAALILVVGPRPSVRRHETWKVIGMGAVGTLEITETTVVRLDEASDEHRAYVRRGVVRARIEHQEAGRSFVLVTPELRIVVVGTRFTVEVEAALTAVHVEEGTVRVESISGRSVALHRGESIDSSDARLAPALKSDSAPSGGAETELGRSALADEPEQRDQPQAARDPERSGQAGPSDRSQQPRAGADPAGATDLACARGSSLEARQRCLEQMAAGTGLAAQNALFALGVLLQRDAQSGAAAIHYWQQYQQRFPNGILAPEVGLALLREFLAEKRYAELLAEIERFRLRFPRDPRGPEVALIRGRVLCTHFGRLSEALEAFDAALTASDRSLRQEALFARGSCTALLEGAPAAAEIWRVYLEDYPGGAHADEVRARLGAVPADAPQQQ